MCVCWTCNNVAVRCSVSAVLLETLDSAIEDCRQGSITPHVEAHNRVKLLYTWQNVAKRTEEVRGMHIPAH